MNPQDEYRKHLNDRYQASRSEFKRGGLYTRWKNLTGAQRIYLAAGVAFLVVVVVMAIGAYWDVPQVPYPSGEGG